MYLYFILITGSLLSSALAAPAQKHRSPPPPPPSPPKPHKGNGSTGLSLQDLQTQQPTNGLVSNSNVTLQFVGLGVGVQNYSCASTTATPKSIGAIATLFDVTATLQANSDLTSALTTKYLQNYESVACTASTNLDDNSCQESINRLNLPLLGKHFFASINGAGVPSFDIYNGDFLSAQKIGDVPAAPGAYAGQNGVGAVDWLFLVQDGSGRSVGLTEVYRINTAGGDPEPTQCSTGVSQFSVKYAAEYWLYE
jgi:hypothetical protein